MMKQYSQKFILVFFTLVMLVSGVMNCAYLGTSANFEIAAHRNVQEIRKSQSTQTVPVFNSEARIAPIVGFVPVRVSRRQGVSGLYRTLLGHVPVTYMPQVKSVFSKFNESLQDMIVTSLDSVILFVQGQDGKK